VSWITVNSGSTGTGNGTVAFTVGANPNGGDRTGTITIEGQTFVVTQTATDSGSGGGCFIATAAFGSPLDSRVNFLREFRDRHLLPHAPGRAMVDFYYQVSPPVAAFLERHETFKIPVRFFLDLLIVGIRFPYLCGVLLLPIPLWALKRSGARRRIRRWKIFIIYFHPPWRGGKSDLSCPRLNFSPSISPFRSNGTSPQKIRPFFAPVRRVLFLRKPSESGKSSNGTSGLPPLLISLLQAWPVSVMAVDPFMRIK
jgi:hypothetical protein